MRKFGIKRHQLFDTEKDRYPEARAWAAAIHAQCLDVQGLCWVSRQDDGGRALILFGDRVADKLLNQAIDSRDITADLDVYSDLLVLADRIGLKIVVSRC
ncbi:RES domain-containing protein [Mesorhizobium sp.]|uniref:RES domain-containing protein n=1 Tax=Mesorhizobium sp. TaxID=1871066 RepID=UPI0025BC32D4|nr:RES domain-containing protein [Mesorhizobium sp.]